VSVRRRLYNILFLRYTYSASFVCISLYPRALFKKAGMVTESFCLPVCLSGMYLRLNLFSEFCVRISFFIHAWHDIPYARLFSSRQNRPGRRFSFSFFLNVFLHSIVRDTFCFLVFCDPGITFFMRGAFAWKCSFTISKRVYSL
jgi:hypothetical protein